MLNLLCILGDIYILIQNPHHIVRTWKHCTWPVTWSPIHNRCNIINYITPLKAFPWSHNHVVPQFLLRQQKCAQHANDITPWCATVSVSSPLPAGLDTLFSPLVSRHTAHLEYLHGCHGAGTDVGCMVTLGGCMNLVHRVKRLYTVIDCCRWPSTDNTNSFSGPLKYSIPCVCCREGVVAKCVL